MASATRYPERRAARNCDPVRFTENQQMADELIVSRRSALKYLSILTASVAGQEFLAAWLPRSAQADDRTGMVTMPGMQDEKASGTPSVAYRPVFFKPEEFRTVEILTEMILPTDDTPGAKEAQVANYIDFVVFSAAEFKPSLQREWLAGLELLDRESLAQFDKPFRECGEPDRTNLLTTISTPERDPKLHHDGFDFFVVLKEMTVEGFYTSKVGLIDVLDFQGLNYMSEFPGCTHPEHQK